MGENPRKEAMGLHGIIKKKSNLQQKCIHIYKKMVPKGRSSLMQRSHNHLLYIALFVIIANVTLPMENFLSYCNTYVYLLARY